MENIELINNEKINNENKILGLYIHIPFCVAKCSYCDFLSSPCDEHTKFAYYQALLKEIQLQGKLYGLKGTNRRISTIFFGGGTPSILNSDYICGIMDTIKDNFCLMENAEISIECNPGTLSKEKLLKYKSCGINRISIGLQTANNHELKAIGRIHTYEQFLESYNMTLEAGFSNVNIDLMSALPYQTISSYEETLDKVLALNPTHISAYSLILEEGTPLLDYISNDHYSILPDEDTDRNMYYLTKEKLAKYGYERYEISNYSKPGFECKHNLSYWQGIDYLGLGLGSSSYIDRKRFKNISNLNDYINIFNKTNANISEIICDEITLSDIDLMEEFMYLGLRKTSGVSIKSFYNLFKKDLLQVFNEPLSKYQSLGLLSIIDDTITLTERGLDVSNTIFADFLLEDTDEINQYN